MKNWKKELRDWSIILGMSSLGTILSFLSWISERPEVQNFIKGLVRA